MALVHERDRPAGAGVAPLLGDLCHRPRHDPLPAVRLRRVRPLQQHLVRTERRGEKPPQRPHPGRFPPRGGALPRETPSPPPPPAPPPPPPRAREPPLPPPRPSPGYAAS